MLGKRMDNRNLVTWCQNPNGIPGAVLLPKAHDKSGVRTRSRPRPNRARPTPVPFHKQGSSQATLPRNGARQTEK